MDLDDVERDLAALGTGKLGSLRHYVSHHVAHIQEEPPANVPTYEDMHAAIDQVGELLRKYMRLVVDEDQILETSMLVDVMAPFRMAWLPPLPERRRPPLT